MGDEIENAKIGWDGGEWPALLSERRMMAGGTLVEGIEGVAWAARDAVDPEDRDPRPWREASAALTAGVFATMYGQAERVDGGPAWARAAVAAIEALPTLDDARAAVVGDPDMAAIATRAMLTALVDRMPEIVQGLRDAGLDPVTGLPVEADADDDAPSADDLSGVVAAVGAGVGIGGHVGAEAVREVVDAREALHGVLPGLGDAPARAEQESPARLALVDRIKNDARLQRVLRVAGRMHRIADRVRRTRTDEIHAEVVDVERGAEIGRILPSELAGLRRGRMARLLVLKGIAERGLLQYRMEGHDLLGRGPIVVLLDTSDSMGAPVGGMRRIDWASAVGIASVRSALLQRRPITVATFSYSVGRSWVIPAGDASAARRAILEIAVLGHDGGTTFDGPVGWALNAGAERDRADLVLVTDGEAYLGSAIRDRLTTAKAAGLRLWAILAGGGNVQSLETFADGIASVDDERAAESIGALGAT